mmetsp:Transcript_23199/g.35837  ORF Transcript_23199/g.35837 Transcript_23199/m.35837 type:complete len:207 (+) Transcript_23199:1688-2308(+)
MARALSMSIPEKASDRLAKKISNPSETNCCTSSQSSATFAIADTSASTIDRAASSFIWSLLNVEYMAARTMSFGTFISVEIVSAILSISSCVTASVTASSATMSCCCVTASSVILSVLVAGAASTSGMAHTPPSQLSALSLAGVESSTVNSSSTSRPNRFMAALTLSSSDSSSVVDTSCVATSSSSVTTALSTSPPLGNRTSAVRD